MAFEQIKIDNAGTYGAYDKGSNQAIAFPDQGSFAQYFPGQTPNPNASLAPFDTSNLLGANAGKLQTISAITPEALAPAAVVPFAQPNPTTIPDVATLYETPELKATPEETKAQDLTNRIQSLNDQLVSKSAYQNEQEVKFGVDQASRTLNDLNSQLIGLKNESAAIPLLLEKANSSKGISSTIMDRQRSTLLRDNAIQALSVSAMMAAASGQLANAQSMADRAVATKFGPLEEEVNAKINNLNLILNSPEYSRQDKNRAQKQLDIQNRNQALIEEQKENARNIQQLALDAAANGADAETLRQISTSRTPIEAAKAISEFRVAQENKQIAAEAGIITNTVNRNGVFYDTSTGKVDSDPKAFFKRVGIPVSDNPTQDEINRGFTEAYRRGLVTDYTPDLVADRDFATQARATFWDAGISVTDNMETVKQKILKSKIYQRSIAPTGGSGGGGVTLSSSQEKIDNRVKQIIAANPGEWGNAADQIDREFGKGMATVYDSWLKSVYQNGQAVGSLGSSGVSAPKLSAAQKDTVDTYRTLSSLASEALALGDKLNWKGTGGLGRGSASQFLARNLGVGSQEEEELRGLIGNINATLAKARGGTSFTEGEKRLLESYTPTINDSPVVLKAKFSNLQKFITTSINNIQGSGSSESVVEYQGRQYRVDAQGNMTPL